MPKSPSTTEIVKTALEQASATTLRLMVDDLADGESVERREKARMWKYVTGKLKDGETSIAKILEYFGEREIKDICQTLGLDTKGRRHALVDQLLRIDIQSSAAGLTDDQKSFIVALEGLGGKATRQQMNQALGPQWDASRYAEVQSALVRAGKVRAIRGRGYNVQIDGPRTEEAKQQDDKKEQFLDRLRANDGMSNPKLMNELGWNQDLYDKIKQQLLDEELITIGRGRGGTVWLTDLASIEPEAAPPSPSTAQDTTQSGTRVPHMFGREADSYAPIVEFFGKAQNWDLLSPVLGRQGFFRPEPESLWVQMTSEQKQDGKWMAPDVCAVVLHDSPYLPAPIVEIYSFEIKVGIQEVNVLAIHEAYGHGRVAHMPFVIFQIEDSKEAEDKLQRKLSTVLTEAGQLGIGVLSVKGDVSDRAHWEAHLAPARRDIAPFMIPHFIKTRMGESTKRIEVQMIKFRTRGLSEQ